MVITHKHLSSEQDNKAISALIVALKTYIHTHLHIHTLIHNKPKSSKVELINRPYYIKHRKKV